MRPRHGFIMRAASGGRGLLDWGGCGAGVIGGTVEAGPRYISKKGVIQMGGMGRDPIKHGMAAKC